MRWSHVGALPILLALTPARTQAAPDRAALTGLPARLEAAGRLPVQPGQQIEGYRVLLHLGPDHEEEVRRWKEELSEAGRPALGTPQGRRWTDSYGTVANLLDQWSAVQPHLIGVADQQGRLEALASVDAHADAEAGTVHIYRLAGAPRNGGFVPGEPARRGAGRTLMAVLARLALAEAERLRAEGATALPRLSVGVAGSEGFYRRLGFRDLQAKQAILDGERLAEVAALRRPQTLAPAVTISPQPQERGRYAERAWRLVERLGRGLKRSPVGRTRLR
jgi:hypothetical protein